MVTVAIIVAAGAGIRMGAGMPKALLPLAGRPMLAWSIDALRASGRVDDMVLVAPAGRAREAEMALGQLAAIATVTPGGASRAESVREGLILVPAGVERVIVHDAARPLVTPELVRAVLDGLDGVDGAIAAAPVADTLKRGDADLAVIGTVGRAGLWSAQTPQAFRAGTLRRAVAQAEGDGSLARATDCASLVEAAGGRVRLVLSGSPNPKVTTPSDLQLAEAILAAHRPGP